MKHLVFKKVADLTNEKTELATVDVKLAVIDQLKGLTKTGVQIAKDLEDPLIKANLIKTEIANKQKELDVSVKLIQKAYNAASKFQDQEDKLYAKIEKAAAELGMKPADISGWADYMSISTRVNSAINEGNQYMV